MVDRTQIMVTLILLLLGLLPAGPGEASVRRPVIEPDESGNVVEVKTNTGTPDTVYFYLNDHLSTPRIVTDDTGQGVWRARYAPFGQVIEQRDTDQDGIYDDPCPLSQPIRFPGQWDDGIEGVWYNWHRFYLPEYGIYGRVDPVFQVGAQVWDYVGGNPVSGIDPEGLEFRREHDPRVTGNFEFTERHVVDHLEFIKWEIVFIAAAQALSLRSIALGAGVVTSANGVGQAGKTVKRAVKAGKSSTGACPGAGTVESGRGFKSYRAFKKAMGPAGPGQSWHHIVEQTPANIQKFGAEAIHNTNNIVKLPWGKGSIHARASGYYSSKGGFESGMTVRRWLSSKSFKDQFEFGMKVLKRFGGQ